jgi:hypothetical protein
MAETTNPTPEEVLAEFQALGKIPILLWQITSVHIRDLTARGVYLADHVSTPEDQDEFDAVEQELANRVMGRAPLLK